MFWLLSLSVALPWPVVTLRQRRLYEATALKMAETALHRDHTVTVNAAIQAIRLSALAVKLHPHHNGQGVIANPQQHVTALAVELLDADAFRQANPNRFRIGWIVWHSWTAIIFIALIATVAAPVPTSLIGHKVVYSVKQFTQIRRSLGYIGHNDIKAVRHYHYCSINDGPLV
jgi:hypothetical protein